MARAEPVHPSNPADTRHGDILIWGQLPTSHGHPPHRAHVHRDPTEAHELAAEPQSAGMHLGKPRCPACQQLRASQGSWDAH